MASEIEAYLTARRAFLATQTRLSAVSDMLQTVATALRDRPDRFVFANVGGGLPPEAVMSRDTVSVDGNTWKSAAQIMDLLADYHRARRQVQDLWSSLSPDVRSGLQPPPEDTPSDGGYRLRL